MNLRDYLLIIRRRKWIGITVVAVALIASALLTTLATPYYQATSSLFVGPQQSLAAVQDPNGAFQFSESLGVAERLTKTYARMIHSLPVAERAVRDGQLNVESSFALRSTLAIPIPDTQLIDVVTTDTDPARAAAVANAMARAFVAIAQQLTSPRGQTSPVVPVTQFERATVPTTPVAPNASRNLSLALILGTLAGLGLMFASEFLDVAVRGAEDVERLVHLPVLALIPEITDKDIVDRAPALLPR